MNERRPSRWLAHGLALVAALALAACGGGGGGDGGSVVAVGGIIGGTGFKGPVANGTVTAYALSGGVPGTALGTGTTDAGGRFSVGIGSYADEATGTNMPMAAGDVMTVVLPGIASGATLSGIQVTPLTSMAQAAAARMSGGMTEANIASANNAVGAYFMVGDIVRTNPMNPLQPGSGATAGQNEMNYGMAIAAMSQYAKGQGMAASSAFVTAMMSDASDGVMNGRMGANPISMSMGGMMGPSMMAANAGTSGLGAAMSAFANSAQNRSGVTATMMAPLINQLNGSNGQIIAATPQAAPSTVSGTVFDGTIKSATVRAFAVEGGVLGAQIASTSTDDQGRFTLALGNYAGPMMLQAVGATYTDLATRATMTMGSGDTMTLAMQAAVDGSGMAGVWITPLTAMAQARAAGMSGGMTGANVAAANAAVGNYFMCGDIVHTPPLNPGATGTATGATQEMKNCGAVIAGMSQYAQAANMPMAASFLTAMMTDAADGVLDGRMNGNPIAMPMGGMMGSSMMAANAGTGGLANAIGTFMNSGANMSGMTATDVAPLLQKLTASDGRL